MALTARRWAIFACLGCAIIALASWPVGSYEDPWWMHTRQSAGDVVRRNLSRAGVALAVLERRDSLLQTRAAQPGDVRVVFDTMIPDPARPKLATAIQSALTVVPSPGVDVRVVVFVSRRTAIRLGREASVLAPLMDYYHFLPAATDGRTCLILAYPEADRLRSLVDTSDEAYRKDWAEHTVAPCAWYRAFGQAGPGVEQWLRNAEYSYAREPDTGHPRARLGERSLGQASIWDMLGLLFGQTSEFEVPTDLRACAHNDFTMCRLLLHPRLERFWLSPFGRGVSVAHRWVTWDYRGESEFNWFLADLHRDIGDARFRRFWTSQASVDSAFRTATGSSMEQWTQRWLKNRIARPLFGPTPTTAALTLGAAFLGLLLGAAGLFATRRQVG